MIDFKKLIFNVSPKKLKAFFYHRYLIELSNKNYNGSKADLKIKDINFSLFLKDQQSYLTYSKFFDEGVVYEETLVFSLTKILEKFKEPSFLDVGSYLGYYSIYPAKLFGTNINIFAFESNKESSSLISKSLELNNIKNVTIFNNVLSNKSEEIITYDTLCLTKNKINSILKSTMDKHEKYILEQMLDKGFKTKSCSLDEICEKNKIIPDVIKIDVHGSEGQVLLGSKNFVLKKAKYIFLELHPDSLLEKNSDGIMSKDIFNLFYDSGFKTYMISPFRYTNRDLDFIRFKKNQKLKYLEITSNNISNTLFDRREDCLILAIHKNFSIEDLAFFEQN